MRGSNSIHIAKMMQGYPITGKRSEMEQAHLRLSSNCSSSSLRSHSSMTLPAASSRTHLVLGRRVIPVTYSHAGDIERGGAGDQRSTPSRLAARQEASRARLTPPTARQLPYPPASLPPLLIILFLGLNVPPGPSPSSPPLIRAPIFFQSILSPSPPTLPGS